MELRKKSLLIALVLGDGYLATTSYTKNNKTYKYCHLEICHSKVQEGYINWKAELCRKLTGKKCNIKEKILKKARVVNGREITNNGALRFTCGGPYFRILKKWLYPNGKKVIGSKYLDYLTPEGLAIWYMDDGSTYIDKARPNVFTCEIYTHTPKEETEFIIDYFKRKWDIQFYLHKKPNNQYTIRCYTVNAAKFISLIRPFVPQCMEYKVKVPEYYFHEISESWKQDYDVF